MSTLFRTKQDTENQEKVARRLEKAWDCYFHLRPGRENPINYDVSWDHAREEMMAVVEIKCRTNLSHAYQGLTMLGLLKYNDMVKESRRTGLPALFVVKFTDCICWINIEDVDASETIFFGRDPRPGSRRDREEMILVPVADMTTVSLGANYGQD